MRKYILFLTLIFSIVSTNLIAQQLEWYYPWNNNIQKLEKITSTDEVPILLNGKNFRILEIKTSQPTIISSIQTTTVQTKIEIFYMPQIKSYSNKDIIDVLIPFKEVTKLSTSHYLLFSFNGIKPGVEDVMINVLINKKNYKLRKKVTVSEEPFSNPISLNVWAYFDYDFLSKGIKNQVVNDLNTHNANILIIPPSQLPTVSKNVKREDINKLEEYIVGTIGKFQYYGLFLGYNEKSNHVMSEEWKEAFKKWIDIINTVFKKKGIPLERVLLYPFDEPQRTSINLLSEMHDWSKSVQVRNPFYVTIGGKERLKSINLATKIEYAQVATKIVPQATKIKGKNTKIFSYSVMSQSRNIQPSKYKELGINAYLFNLSGIGVWNYSDMKHALDESGIRSLAKGQASWDLKVKDFTKDYSLIYRKDNSLYSSLRWEALSYGLAEYQYLKKFERKMGKLKANELCQKLLNKSISNSEWEKLKVKLN